MSTVGVKHLQRMFEKERMMELMDLHINLAADNFQIVVVDCVVVMCFVLVQKGKIHYVNSVGMLIKSDLAVDDN